MAEAVTASVDQSSRQPVLPCRASWVCSLPPAGQETTKGWTPVTCLVKRSSGQLPLLLGQVGIPSDVRSGASLARPCLG